MSGNNGVYRKKSLDRINSINELNDYIKVASPGAWIIIIGVIIFLVGVCAWGVFGRLDSVVNGSVIVKNGSARLFVSDLDISKVKSDAEVSYGGAQAKVVDISTSPMKASSLGDEYFLYTSNFSSGEWVYVCSLSAADRELADGVYEAKAIVGKTSPMTFVTN